MKNTVDRDIKRIAKCMGTTIYELLYPSDQAAEALGYFLNEKIGHNGLKIIAELIIEENMKHCGEVLWLENQGYLEFGPGYSHFTKSGLKYLETCRKSVQRSFSENENRS